MKKLFLFIIALMGAPSLMMADDDTPAGPVTLANQVAGALDGAEDFVGQVQAAVGDGSGVLETVQNRAGEAQDQAKGWLAKARSGVGSAWHGLGRFNQGRKDIGINNLDATLGLGSIGALAAWLGYHGWKTRQARREMAFAAHKSKIAQLLKKADQAKTPQERNQAMFEYRQARRAAIAAFKPKQSWRQQWTDRLRNAFRGDYGVGHQVFSGLAPAFAGATLLNHGWHNKDRWLAKKQADDIAVAQTAAALAAEQAEINARLAAEEAEGPDYDAAGMWYGGQVPALTATPAAHSLVSSPVSASLPSTGSVFRDAVGGSGPVHQAVVSPGTTGGSSRRGGGGSRKPHVSKKVRIQRAARAREAAAAAAAANV